MDLGIETLSMIEFPTDCRSFIVQGIDIISLFHSKDLIIRFLEIYEADNSFLGKILANISENDLKCDYSRVFVFVHTVYLVIGEGFIPDSEFVEKCSIFLEILSNINEENRILVSIILNSIYNRSKGAMFLVYCSFFRNNSTLDELCREKNISIIMNVNDYVETKDYEMVIPIILSILRAKNQSLLYIASISHRIIELLTIIIDYTKSDSVLIELTKVIALLCTSIGKIDYPVIQLLMYIVEKPKINIQYEDVERIIIDGLHFFVLTENDESTPQIPISCISFFYQLPIVKIFMEFLEPLKKLPKHLIISLFITISSHFLNIFNEVLFTLVLLSEIEDMYSDLSRYYRSYNDIKFLLNPLIWDPKVKSNFLSDSFIFLVRQKTMSVFDKLIFSNNVDLGISILNDFSNILIFYPELFAEYIVILSMSQSQDSLFKRIIYNGSTIQFFNIIGSGMLIQQTFHIKYKVKAYRIRQYTFNIIINCLQSINEKIALYFVSSQLHEALLCFIGDSSFYSSSFTFIQHIYSYCLNNDVFCPDDLFSSLKNRILLCKESDYELCNKLLTLFFNSLLLVQRPKLVKLPLSSFLSSLQCLFSRFQSNQNIYIKLLHCFHLLTLNDPLYISKIDYSMIARFIKNIGIDDQVYQALLWVISGNYAQFQSIILQQSSLFITMILESDYCLDFLNRIDTMIDSSFVQILLISSKGIDSCILDFLKNVTNDDILSCSIRIIEKVFMTICSRASYFSFLRLMNPFYCVHSLQHYHKFLSMSQKILSIQTKYPPILQICFYDNQIYLPEFIYQNINDGMTFIFDLLFVGLSHSNSISVLQFVIGTDDYSIQITKYGFKVRSSLFNSGTEIIGDCDIPINKWMKLIITFKGFGICCIYINDNMVFSYNIMTKGKQNDALYCTSLNPRFEEEEPYIDIPHVHFSGLKVAYNYHDLESLITVDNFDLVFLPKYIKDGKMINVGSSNSPPILYKAEYFPCVPSFSEVFTASNGLGFYVSLFLRIDNGIITQKVDQDFYIRLISTLGIILKDNSQLQENFLKMEGYSIISYFLSVSKNIVRSIGLWDTFNQQQNGLCDDLICQLHKFILLNMAIWMESGPDLRIRIYNDWLFLARTNPMLFSSNITFGKILELINFHFLCRHKPDEIFSLLSQILFELSKSSFNKNDYLAFISLSTSINQTSVLSSILFSMSRSIQNALSIIPCDFPNLSCFSFFQNHKSPRIRMIIGTEFAILDNQVLRNFLYVLAVEKCEGLFNEVVNYFSNHISKFHVLMTCFPILITSACLEYSEITDTFFTEIITQNILPIDHIDMRPISLLVLVYYICFVSKDALFKQTMARFSCMNPTIISSILSIMNSFMISFSINMKPHIEEYLLMIMNIIILDRKYYSRMAIDIIIDCFLYEYVIDNIKERNVDLSEVISIAGSFLCSKDPNYAFVNFQNIEVYLTFIDIIEIKVEDIASNTRIPFVILSLIHFSIPEVYIEKLFCLFIDDKYINILIPSFLFGFTQHVNPKLTEISCYQIFKMKKSPIELYRKSTNIFIEYVIKSKNCINKFNDNLNSSIDPIDYHVYGDPKTYYDNIVVSNSHESAVKFSHSKRAWNKVYQSLYYEGSPFLSKIINESSQHFFFGNFYDSKFLPSVLMRNHKFVSQSFFLQSKRHFDVFRGNNDIVHDHHLKKPDHILWYHLSERIKVLSRKMGYFFVESSLLRFISEDQSVTVIEGFQIRDVFWFWYNQLPNSIQIFTWNNKCYLFRFPEIQGHSFVQNLHRCSMPNLRFFQENNPINEISKLGLTQKWIDRHISTTEYLMWLNLLSGRSFLSAKNYPVFPFLLLDCEGGYNPESETLYRDLSTNIAVLNDDNIPLLKDQKDAYEKDTGYSYWHSSLYSNPVSLVYFLVRTDPFSTLHVRLQDGKFDNPSRLFRSIPYIMNKATSVPGFNRELVPELFFCDSLFYNENKYELGQDQDNFVVKDVEVPSWSTSPSDFVSKNHEALESDYTSSHIHNWIDLIWGYKQRGKIADDHFNTYPPQIYSESWKNQNMKTQEIEASLECIGQVPQQLFSSPHPIRLQSSSLKKASIFVLSQLEAPVLSFSCIGNTLISLRLYAVLTNHRLYCLRTSGTHFPICPQGFSVVPKFPTSPHRLCFVDPTTILFASNYSTVPSCYSLDDGILESAKSTPHLQYISSVCASDSYLLTGGQDACVALWTRKDRRIVHQASLLTHISSITCIRVSKVASIAISLSSDGEIVTSRMPNLSFIRSIRMSFPNNENPNNIIITSEIQYIIVHSNHCIKSATINGRILAERTLKKQIISACHFVGKKFIDYIAIVTESNKIKVLDPVSLSVCKVISTHQNDIITQIMYNHEMKFIVAATNHCLVLFIPIDI